MRILSHLAASKVMLAKCAKACVQLAILLKRSKHSAIHLRDGRGKKSAVPAKKRLLTA